MQTATAPCSVHPSLNELADVPVAGVRVWTAHVESLSPMEIEELTAHLDPNERARGARFYFERDRRRYVATRGLLRSLLGALLQQSAAALVFEYGPHGKPSLARNGNSDSSLFFNLSHADGWAMFAIAENREIGIDLECAARLDRNAEDLERLAARILSARELAIWQLLPQLVDRRAAFLRAWTRKEACVKATGQGMFDGFTGLEVALDAAAPARSLALRTNAGALGLTNTVEVHDLSAPPGFAAALALTQSADHDVAHGGGAVSAKAGNA